MQRRSPSRILVGIDFSDASLQAAAWARGLADSTGADLVLCHVVTPVSSLFPSTEVPALAELFGSEELEQLPGLRAAEARKRLRTEGRRLGITGAEVDVHVGLPAEGIVGRATKVDADMIVVAAQGLTGDAQGRIGSVAERVVRHASVPVAVVRAPR